MTLLFRRFCIVLVLLPLSVLAQTNASSVRTIILARHAERITPNADVGLSDKGKLRSKSLAYLLKDVRFDAIFTSQAIRTIETAQPVVEALGIRAEIVDSTKPEELAAKLRQLKPGASALVVNHSNTVPRIAELLGAGKIAPILDEEFDRLLIVTLPPSGAPSVVTLRYGGQ